MSRSKGRARIWYTACLHACERERSDQKKRRKREKRGRDGAAREKGKRHSGAREREMGKESGGIRVGLGFISAEIT